MLLEVRPDKDCGKKYAVNPETKMLTRKKFEVSNDTDSSLSQDEPGIESERRFPFPLVKNL